MSNKNYVGKTSNNYVVLGKETKYFETYVKAESEEEALEKATDIHINEGIHEVGEEGVIGDEYTIHLIDEGGFYKSEYVYEADAWDSGWIFNKYPKEAEDE